MTGPSSISTWLMRFHNTGSVTIKDVVVRLTLPPNVQQVPGSVVLYSSNHPGGDFVGKPADEAFAAQGFRIGAFAADGAGHVRFSIQPSSTTAWGCGDNRAVLKVSADTDVGGKSTDVTLIVHRQC